MSFQHRLMSIFRVSEKLIKSVFINFHTMHSQVSGKSSKMLKVVEEAATSLKNIEANFSFRPSKSSPAFKLSEFSQKLTCKGMRDPCPLPAMKAKDFLFNRQAQSYQDWNKTFEVGLWHEISPAGRLRGVKQGLIALTFGVMERSRGVPRCGRCGVVWCVV